MTWTVERVDQLQTYWKSGLSARLIGMRLRITRNAVIGKLNRMGLSRPRPLKRYRSAKPKPPRSYSPATKKHLAVAEVAYKAVSAPKVDDLNIPQSQRKTFNQLKAGMCKFPVGNPGEPDFFFCGAECDRTVSYCDAHAKRCGGGKS